MPRPPSRPARRATPLFLTLGLVLGSAISIRVLLLSISSVNVREANLPGHNQSITASTPIADGAEVVRAEEVVTIPNALPQDQAATSAPAASLVTALQAARYAVERVDASRANRRDAAYFAQNPRQRMSVWFSGDGVEFSGNGSRLRGRTVGASRMPTTATNAKKRPMVVPILTACIISHLAPCP